jgi:hypothetical protein
MKYEETSVINNTRAFKRQKRDSNSKCAGEMKIIMHTHRLLANPAIKDYLKFLLLISLMKLSCPSLKTRQ